MKTKNNMAPANKKSMAPENKKCTCSAIQQCELHRISRIPQTDAGAATKQGRHNKQVYKGSIRKEGKK